MAGYEGIIDREHLDDIEAIVRIRNDDPDALDHTTPNNADTTFTWDYERSRPALGKLYERAKTAQWNAETDLDWSIDVDVEKVIAEDITANVRIDPQRDLSGTCFASWGDKEWTTFGIEARRWTLSQFMHGEQGALVCTAKIVETVPWIDAKYYASTQVMDEARHVEVFAKYLRTKMGGEYPVNAHLRMLLDDIVADSRWDMTYLGMQIMVEGLALAAFGFMHQFTQEPLLKKLLRYVMSDEARHVAFGVLSLQEIYKEMTLAEIRERQEFAFEAAVRMRDRFLQQEVWERMGIPPKEAIELILVDDGRREFQKMLFSKIVPNCKKLGLLDAGDAWLRRRFEEMGVIHFEDWVDTGAEYELLDEVTADRTAAEAAVA